jgi:hypothetical protein
MKITTKDGKVQLKDGKPSAGDCCCRNCEGPCDNANPCPEGCECCEGQCKPEPCETGCCEFTEGDTTRCETLPQAKCDEQGGTFKKDAKCEENTCKEPCEASCYVVSGSPGGGDCCAAPGCCNYSGSGINEKLAGGGGSWSKNNAGPVGTSTWVLTRNGRSWTLENQCQAGCHIGQYVGGVDDWDGCGCKTFEMENGYPSLQVCETDDCTEPPPPMPKWTPDCGGIGACFEDWNGQFETQGECQAGWENVCGKIGWNPDCGWMRNCTQQAHGQFADEAACKNGWEEACGKIGWEPDCWGDMCYEQVGGRFATQQECVDGLDAVCGPKKWNPICWWAQGDCAPERGGAFATQQECVDGWAQWCGMRAIQAKREEAKKRYPPEAFGFNPLP